MKNVNRGNLELRTFDPDKDFAQSVAVADAVKAGKLLATGDCDAFVQGCMGVMGAARHLRNMPVPKEVIFPITVIDSTNYHYLIGNYELKIMCFDLYILLK